MTFHLRLRRGGALVAAATAGLSAALLLFWLAAARAVPRYSARYEQNCSLCHVNPAGGGMRSLYASQYIVPEELAWSTPHDDVLEAIDPEITKNVMIGADVRTLFAYSDDDTRNLNFFQMQGDLYLNFQMGDRLAVYFDAGNSGRYEVYGTAWLLPGSGYVRVGRFLPTYGWKFEDHTMYTRSQLGFNPPAHTDVGAEFGWYPRRFAVHVGVLNGNSGATLDNNRSLAAVVRGAWRFRVGGVGAGVGVSGYRNRTLDADRDTGGAFGYLTWKRFTWVGEGDLYRIDPFDAGHQTGLVTSHQLTFLIRRGLEAEATYDFNDPDWNRKSGAERRFGGGLYALASPFLGVEALVRLTEFEDGEDLSGNDFYEAIFQFHFLY